MTFWFRFRSSFAAALTASLAFAGAGFAAEPYDTFLETHCIKCHGPEKEKGDLRIDQLSRDFKVGADTHHWAEVIEQVNSGEMPPKKDKEKKPTQAEMAAFVTSLDARIKEGKAARMAARPAVAHYRLSRKEYQNTVYDLLGVRYDPAKPGELNEDTLWHGFERIGSELSPSHVDRYYRAAELVLERAFPAAAAGEARKLCKTGAEIRDLEAKKLLDKTLIVITTEFGRPPEFDSGGGHCHQGSAFTCVLAGGGLRHCGAWGETDELSKEIVANPVSVPDFFATICAALGVDYRKNLYDGDRPVPITDQGSPIAARFA